MLDRRPPADGHGLRGQRDRWCRRYDRGGPGRLGGFRRLRGFGHGRHGSRRLGHGPRLRQHGTWQRRRSLRQRRLRGRRPRLHGRARRGLLCPRCAAAAARQIREAEDDQEDLHRHRGRTRSRRRGQAEAVAVQRHHARTHSAGEGRRQVRHHARQRRLDGAFDRLPCRRARSRPADAHDCPR